MRIYSTRNILGVFALNEEGKLLEFIPFNDNAAIVGKKLTEKTLLEEEKKLAQKFKGNEIIFEVEAEGYPSRVPNKAGEFLRSGLDSYLKGIGVDRKSYNLKLREVCFALAREKAREALSEKDKMVIEAVKALDELNETLNLLSERLRSWYSLHYPELSSRVEEHERYAQLIAEHGRRENFREEEISMGVDITEREEEVLRGFSESISSLYRQRKEIEEFLEEELSQVALNLKYLVGSALAARLIALAGGLRNLAFMPASRIQILGAEKALFRHLKRKAKPPKHGIIFQLPVVKSSPWWIRGKIARSLAASLAIAARVDAFSGEFIGEKLKEKFEKRVEALKKEKKRRRKK